MRLQGPKRQRISARTPRPRWSLTLVLIVLSLFVASPAVAEEGGEAVSERSASEKRRLGYALLGSSVAIGLMMVGAYAYLRRRQRRTRMGPVGVALSAGSRASRGRRRRSAASSTGATGSVIDPPAAVAGSWSETLARTTLEFDPTHGEELSRECPECSRAFDSTLLICPHDSTPLRSLPSGARRRSREAPETLDRLKCKGCGRRHEMGVAFCYIDGRALSPDTRESTTKAPTFKACESCGWEGDAEQLTCPDCSDDDGELIAVDPAQTTPMTPAIPLTICPKCRVYGAPGQAYCADDGEVLEPLLSMRHATFPAHGFGPRRKICGDCGAQFGSFARYCSKDGSKLLALN